MILKDLLVYFVRHMPSKWLSGFVCVCVCVCVCVHSILAGEFQADFLLVVILDFTTLVLHSVLKDTTVRIWDTFLGKYHVILTAHADAVQCVKWGGTDLLYTASTDRTIKVWKSDVSKQ